ncbi:hypothetical protein SLEP1_g44281 [Rubroshorea leprosula]|uniref:Uncharacterized protein n=1 Tax=Rubroshorea leprosula TaxID=152421 RepID=A0AAV5LGW5_9ROSI|nr:hypothetical protein SLEP1_g44281 [Rubroshorea leprosula]
MLKEGAQEGLWTYCYPELSCTEKENSGNSSVNYRVQKMVNNGPQDTVVVMDYVSTQLQQENARKMRNRIRKKLFAAKLPGTTLGTVLAAKVSTEVFIKISTAVSIFSYNLFFWMGAQCYDLGEMENDTADENNFGETGEQDDTADENESGETGEQDNESGETEGQDEKGEEKIDGKCGKQISEVKKAVEAVLKLLPLWLTFASTCYLVNATAESFFMEQVDYLENNTESFKIPKSVFFSFPDIVSHITWQVSDYLVEQFHDENKEARWARLLRISIGMLFSSLCCIVASLVAHRLDSNYNSASMLWLLLQFLLWVGSDNDISKSHLDNYYRMLAIITLSSTFVFTVVGIAYELREKEDTAKSGKKG